jgi:hypothetical protein
MAERANEVSPYLKQAGFVGASLESSEGRDLPQELARRTPAFEQEEADIM